MIGWKHIGIGLFFMVSCATGFAQTKEELHDKIDKKEKEIETANQLLEETRISKKSSLNELYILQRRIELRNELIEHLTDQIERFDQQIEQNKKTIDQLEKELEKLKENYAKIILTAYRHKRGFNKLMFILSSESFNQAYKRFKYLNQIAEYRRDQAQQIRVKTEKLRYKIKELENMKGQKNELLSQKTSEKYRLKNEKTGIQEQLNNLQDKEQGLRKDIAQNKNVVDQLEKEIAKIIEEERNKTDLWKDLTDRQKEISMSFENNKGTLPWPISNGIITRKYGVHSHPVLKNIKINNNGVDISATQNSKVRSIWDGITRKVISIPGANLTVIIRHGNYLSVYSNLVDVEVKTGEPVSQGEIIGQVFNDPSRNETVLHLEIYKENQKLNPEEWLE